MKYIAHIIIGLIVFALTSLFAQQQRGVHKGITERDIVYAKHDTQRVRYLIELVDSIYDEQIWPRYNEQAFTIGKRLSQDKNIEIAAIGKRYLADAINNRGYLKDNQGDYTGALIEYFEALEIREGIDYKKGIASSYNNIGTIFQKQKDLNRALDYYQKSFAIRKEEDDKIGMAKLLSHIGEIYIVKTDYDTALVYMTKSLNLARAANTADAIGTALLNISDIYILLGKYDLAQANIKEAIVFLSKINSTKGLLAAQIKLGLIKIEQKQYTNAIAIGNTALQTAEKFKFLESKNTVYQLLSNAYEKQGNTNMAYRYFKMFVALRDSLSKQNTGVIKQQLQYEFGKKEAENQGIQKEKDIHDQYVRNILLASCIVLFLFVGILMNRNYIRQKANEDLADKNTIIEQEKQRAEQSERYKSQFLSNISHEIRTPMNAILGMSDLLIATNVNEQQLKYINAIKKSSENLSLIINDVLDFSKIEAGKVELENIPFRPRDVVEDVYNTLKFKAEEKSLDFRLFVDERVAPILWGDNFRLYQILMNLTGNAIKFTEKGTVFIEIILLEQTPTSQVLRYYVKDTGVGIAHEKKSTIFNSFQQAEQSTSRRYGGTGLGLSIAQQLVKLRNSEIFVESELGKGSTFYFDVTYPIANEEEFAKINIEDNIKEHTQFKGIKILLAEDNEYNQIVAVESLIRHLDNCEVQVANNGKEVIVLLERNEYDIVLMDLSMPEMDGYEATRHIRQNFEGDKATIPIIALTAFAFEEEEKCLEAGMNAYLTKPFKISHLLSLMSKFILAEKTKREENTTKKNDTKGTFPILDLSFIEDFTENDKEQTRYFIEKFITNVPKELNLIQIAMQSEDYELIRKAVHTFKPQVEFVGIIAATQTIKALEQKIKEKQPFQNIEAEFIVLTQQIEEGISKLKEHI
jgi:signal transduction histidine kinase/CheY-like chemotaxis protein